MTDPLLEALRRLTGRPDAEFREHQRDAVDALVAKRSRVLLVQRTGWGKSAVYFLATSLLRSQGAGPTLLVSPLLALMRNQMEAASRLGLRAMTINSASDTTLDQLASLLAEDSVDLVLVSPERLANPEFADRIMPLVGGRPGLIVIDEVHCISDWGHDFRPDYRRIVAVLEQLVATVPVLGCTATANDRVVADVADQLGTGLTTFRGPLRRHGLALSVIELDDPSDRLAWLSTQLDQLPGSGIVYCLTIDDVHTVTEWLADQGHQVLAYTGASDSEDRLEAERRLQANEVKALVATTALGMGYDKPDLGFVVHYQSPGSPVGYYQQVGRAGRALDRSQAILLVGREDRAIQDHFIERAFPAADRVEELLTVFEHHGGPVTVNRILDEVNLRTADVELILKQLSVEGVVRRITAKTYERTGQHWEYPTERVNAVTAARRTEQAEMAGYIDSHDCRMAFLTRLLDDEDISACGICDRCTGAVFDEATAVTERARADAFLRGRPLTIEPRRQGVRPAARCQPGRALARWGSAGWGPVIRHGREVAGEFGEPLMEALEELVRDWAPEPAPTWVTAVPSTRSPMLVSSLAQRLADRLELPFRACVSRTVQRHPQSEMRNTPQQRANVADAFEICAMVPPGAVLLVDDLVDSRWTLTEVGRVLRLGGAGPVHPVALASFFGRS
jgi:ATP-dependent DNA helicase RecQ